MKREFFLLVFLSCFLNANVKIHLGNYFPKTYDINKSKSPKVFIAAGIHGDEFGGFLSALYLYKTLDTKNGNIKFLPFLNIESLVVNFRYMINGGDMNDKFVFSDHNILGLSSRYFRKIQYTKNEILKFNPDVVFSLHAGWGYSYLDNKRWGNSIVIDENKYKDKNLLTKASQVVNEINAKNIYKHHPYTLKVLHTFSKNKKADMNDFSAWVLKSGFKAFSIESSKNLRIRTQIYNTSFSTLEFLKLYGIEVKNREKVLSLENIKNFLNELKKNKTFFNIKINDKKQKLICNYNERKIINVNRGDLVTIDEVELAQMGYFVVPKSEKNYKMLYNIKNNLNFKIKYFNINKKIYDNFCYIKFIVKKQNGVNLSSRL